MLGIKVCSAHYPDVCGTSTGMKRRNFMYYFSLIQAVSNPEIDPTTFLCCIKLVISSLCNYKAVNYLFPCIQISTCKSEHINCRSVKVRTWGLVLIGDLSLPMGMFQIGHLLHYESHVSTSLLMMGTVVSGWSRLYCLIVVTWVCLWL